MKLRLPKLAPIRATKTVTSNTPDAQGYSQPLLYVNGPHPGLVFDATEYVQHAVGGAATLLVTDYGVHPDWIARNCIFRYIPAPPAINGGRWCWRAYNLSGLIERCRFAGAGEEHGLYCGIYDDTLVENVSIANCGSQGMQWSLKFPAPVGGTGYPRTSPSWPRNRTLMIRDVNIVECGRPGGTRLGFVFSAFEHGPQFELDCERMFIQTVEQEAVVTNSGGQVCNSTGGIFVGFCKRASFVNCQVELNKPEKGCAQFYDYNTSAPSENAPQELVLDGCTFIGGFVDVRLDETPTIRIKGCKGDAKLRLWNWSGSLKKWIANTGQSIGIPYARG